MIIYNLYTQRDQRKTGVLLQLYIRKWMLKDWRQFYNNYYYADRYDIKMKGTKVQTLGANAVAGAWLAG